MDFLDTHMIEPDDEEYYESYCLGLDTYIVLKTNDNRDFVIKIATDPYDPNDLNLEDAELELYV